jgi:DNA-binding MarR family transcriptional regulator
MPAGYRPQRTGPAMKAAVRYVAEHPGCTKYAAGTAMGPTNAIAWRAINRAIEAGLIEAKAGENRRQGYALTVTEQGEKLMAEGQ